MNTLIPKVPNRSTMFKGLAKAKAPLLPGVPPALVRTCSNCQEPAESTRGAFCTYCGHGEFNVGIPSRLVVKGLTAAGSVACRAAGVDDDTFFSVAAGGSTDALPTEALEMVARILGIETDATNKDGQAPK